MGGVEWGGLCVGGWGGARGCPGCKEGPRGMPGSVALMALGLRSAGTAQPGNGTFQRASRFAGAQAFPSIPAPSALPCFVPRRQPCSPYPCSTSPPASFLSLRRRGRCCRGCCGRRGRARPSLPPSAHASNAKCTGEWPVVWEGERVGGRVGGRAGGRARPSLPPSARASSAGRVGGWWREGALYTHTLGQQSSRQWHGPWPHPAATHC